jgi:hypothetical protein
VEKELRFFLACETPERKGIPGEIISTGGS